MGKRVEVWRRFGVDLGNGSDNGGLVRGGKCGWRGNRVAHYG